MAEKKTESKKFDPESLADFEDSMKRIEEIIKSLENGKAGLGESMKLYEEGISLIGKCSGQLEAAERRITVLQKCKEGGICEVPFKTEDAGQ